jgi:LemA protein
MSILVGLLIVLVAVGFVIYAIIIYNELVRLRNDNDRAWANIDVLLKQRHDEIPNLVETVKGYMQHERQKAQADLLITGALRGLFAVAENYPNLKANQNFLKLQNRISELEERIADRREFFNDDVNTYNTRIKQIPDLFLANMMGLKAREMFKVSEEERRAVEVKLSQEQKSAGAL